MRKNNTTNASYLPKNHPFPPQQTGATWSVFPSRTGCGPASAITFWKNVGISGSASALTAPRNNLRRRDSTADLANFFANACSAGTGRVSAWRVFSSTTSSQVRFSVSRNAMEAFVSSFDSGEESDDSSENPSEEASSEEASSGEASSEEASSEEASSGDVLAPFFFFEVVRLWREAPC